MRDLIDFVEFVGLPILIGTIILVTIAWGGSAWSCGGYGSVTGKETQTSALNCYVKVEGEWMLQTEYEKVIIAREGLTR